MAKVVAEHFMGRCILGGAVVAMLVPTETIRRVRQLVCRHLNLRDERALAGLVYMVSIKASTNAEAVRLHYTFSFWLYEQLNATCL